MRRFASGLLALLLVSTLSAPAAGAAETYTLDPVHSVVIFKIQHLGVSNFLGRFNNPSGTFTLDTESPAQSSFEVSVKADAVDTFSEKRDQHLKSPDFLNAVQFPTITLKSKSVKKVDDKTYRVTGELSLHGVTKEVSFDVKHIGTGKDPSGASRAGFETTFAIQRGDYGINFMPGGLGPEVTLIVSVEGTRK